MAASIVDELARSGSINQDALATSFGVHFDRAHGRFSDTGSVFNDVLSGHIGNVDLACRAERRRRSDRFIFDTACHD